MGSLRILGLELFHREDPDLGELHISGPVNADLAACLDVSREVQDIVAAKLAIADDDALSACALELHTVVRIDVEEAAIAEGPQVLHLRVAAEALLVRHMAAAIGQPVEVVAPADDAEAPEQI